MTRKIVRTKLLTESNPDGFVSDEPEFEVYCSIDGCKFGLAAHEMCEYFEEFVLSERGERIGVRCARPAGHVQVPPPGSEDAPPAGDTDLP
jgi:hypothetical protein